MVQSVLIATRRLKQDIRNIKWAIIFLIAFFLFLFIIWGSICPLVCLTGFPCPACGLTRAGLCLLTFHFRRAWEIQPWIYPLVIWILAAAWNRYLKDMGIGRLLKTAGCILILSMLLFYVYKMHLCFPEQPPYTYHEHNLIHDIYLRTYQHQIVFLKVL